MQACDKYREMISAMIDGELSKEEIDELKEHLDICPECEQVYVMYSLLHEETAELAVDVPEELSSCVMRSVHNVSKKPSFLLRFKFTAAAAVIVLIIHAASGPIQKYIPKAETHSPSISQEEATKNNSLSDIPMKFSGGSSTSPEKPTTPDTNVIPNTNDTVSPSPSKTDQPNITRKSIKSPRTSVPKPKVQTPIILKPEIQDTHSITKDAVDTPMHNKEVTEETTPNKTGPSTENIQPNTPMISSPNEPSPDEANTSDQDTETSKGGVSEKNDVQAPPPESSLSDTKTEPEKPSVEESDSNAKPSITPPTSADNSMSGGAGSSTSTPIKYTLPEIPYTEEFAFYIIVKKANIPEALKNQKADIYKSNLFFKVEINLENTILSELKTNSVPFTHITNSNKGLTHGLFIILND